MKKVIWIFLVSLILLVRCSHSEDEVIPDYEIYPIGVVTSPLFGYSDIDAVTAHMYVVINQGDTLVTDFWDKEANDCSQVYLTGKRIPYEYPAILDLSVKVLYRLKGNDYYSYVEELPYHKQFTYVTLAFMIKTKGSSSKQETFVTELLDESTDHFVWEVQKIFE